MVKDKSYSCWFPQFRYLHILFIKSRVSIFVYHPMCLVRLITEMYIFTNLFLVLLMHDVICHEHCLVIEERMNRLEKSLLSQMNFIKYEVAWLKDTMISKFSPTTDRQDPTYQVNIHLLAFENLAISLSVHFWK